ncbi:hypothetical protein FA95DRAFT_1567468 [Auriscalpium vulgare]|uniref:Uncharacterized protein n=1 Tax=Auriscalpium vulgare TaxID=40419 RepID=A0ACB8R454_9AGAM|nr:hypothetical protein FA95DRAFT_1567468 [Auriscalpium vulgare]
MNEEGQRKAVKGDSREALLRASRRQGKPGEAHAGSDIWPRPPSLTSPIALTRRSSSLGDATLAEKLVHTHSPPPPASFPLLPCPTFTPIQQAQVSKFHELVVSAILCQLRAPCALACVPAVNVRAGGMSSSSTRSPQVLSVQHEIHASGGWMRDEETLSIPPAQYPKQNAEPHVPLMPRLSSAQAVRVLTETHLTNRASLTSASPHKELRQDLAQRLQTAARRASVTKTSYEVQIARQLNLKRET